MPEQKPICSIISRSNVVRIRRRWASSSLPAFSSLGSSSDSSCRMVPMARFMVSGLAA